ncbi:MAG: NAD(P)-dependent oxidoreductase [Deltaproteobacteria bacterium]|nr:NAD(P)-dependent oxidoreductase [Deltaproteobacteria bacterium]
MGIKNIGWIGTGVMGSSMCMHIVKAGFNVFVYNRTKEKASDLINKGAAWVDSAGEMAGKIDIIFSIVGYPKDVEETILGKNGVLENMRDDSIIVDMTTSSPVLAENIYAEAKKKSIFALDAPVSGGDVGAVEGTLAIMVGGDFGAYKKALPFFRIMGKNIAYMGKAGNGQHTKMSNQILIAGTMTGVVESLLYAYKSGINLDEVIDVIGKGAAASWSINNLGRRIAKRDFKPGFFIKHFVKDMGIALEEAKRMKLSLPGLALANQFYLSAVSLGFENLGTQGLYKVFEKMNNVNSNRPNII